MVSRITIPAFLDEAPQLVLDVRSPGEFAQAHIPGSINLPLFNDAERKAVGTLYKQQGKQKAIQAGLDFWGPKMRGMTQEVDTIWQQHNGNNTAEKKVVVHCWRGGMRSAGVAWLLDLYGYQVTTLIGGYKAYRRWALAQFEQPWPMKILGGYTGSGKTDILHKLKEKCPVIDLEAMANHQGSAFGGIGRSGQPSQEMFENLLAYQLHKTLGKMFWIEDESQRVGNNIVPNAFWKTMRSSPVYFIDMPFEERLQRITESYGSHPIKNLVDATLRIQKRLGPNETKLTTQALEDGRVADAFRILLRYYDKLYKKSLQNRDGFEGLVTTLPCSSVEDCLAAVQRG